MTTYIAAIVRQTSQMTLVCIHTLSVGDRLSLHFNVWSPKFIHFEWLYFAWILIRVGLFGLSFMHCYLLYVRAIIIKIYSEIECSNIEILVGIKCFIIFLSALIFESRFKNLISIYTSGVEVYYSPVNRNEFSLNISHIIWSHWICIH